MKALLFTSLVLGSATYLIASQSNTVQQWFETVQPRAQEVVSKSQTQLNRVLEKTDAFSRDITGSQMVSELKDTVSALQEEIATLRSELASKNTHTEQAIVADTLSTHSLEPAISDGMPSEPPKGQNQIEQTSPFVENVMPKTLPYMPVEERSDALMALVQRMEMKAAGY